MKNWIIALIVILIVFAIILVRRYVILNNNFENSLKQDVAFEKYKIKTNNFTNCELGDLVGDDVKSVKYKGYSFDYHKSDFSEKQIIQYAKECINQNLKTDYQLTCCVVYKQYPDD